MIFNISQKNQNQLKNCTSNTLAGVIFNLRRVRFAELWGLLLTLAIFLQKYKQITFGSKLSNLLLCVGKLNKNHYILSNFFQFIVPYIHPQQQNLTGVDFTSNLAGQFRNLYKNYWIYRVFEFMQKLQKIW